MKVHTHLLIIFVTVFSMPCIADAQIITTVAGDGFGGYNGDNISAITANMEPNWVTLDAKGNMYISEVNGRIRKVDTAGIITTFAGTGSVGYNGDSGLATMAEIAQPYGIRSDKTGNIYFADFGANCVRKIDISGIITTVAGTGLFGSTGDYGFATDATLDPMDIVLDNKGNLYITDVLYCNIRKVDTAGIITTIAGVAGNCSYGGESIPATEATLNRPNGITVDSIGNIYFTEFTHVRKIDTAGIITTVAGIDTFGYRGDNGPADSAELGGAAGIAIDATGNLLFCDEHNSVIRKIDTSGIITTIAGIGTGGYSGDNGPAIDAKLGNPDGITLDGIGNIYFADGGNSRVRKISNASLFVKILHNTVNGIMVYPNPSNTGYITVAVSSTVTGQCRIVITNALGQQIIEKTIETNKPADITIDVAPGIYFISAYTGEYICSRQLIVTDK